MTRKYNRKDSLGAFTNAYIEAALWSSTDESDDSGGEPLDKNYSASDIADATIEKMIADCDDFEERFGKLIHDDDSPQLEKYGRTEVAGHDFWLSRNGHGSNFADGDWPKHGDELQAAAESYGQFDLYVGDDGEIHGTPLDSGVGEARETGHRVADFNTLDDLIEHARKEGATHVSYEHDLHGNKLYFPRKDGQYAVANIWQKSGYWHAAKPNDREVVRHLPQGAVPLRAHRGAAEARSEHVEDGDYVVQGCYSDGRIAEEFGLDDEHDAVNEAVRLARSPHFEGDYVRVITRDGELVWDSRPEYAREGVREAPIDRADLQRTADALYGTHWFKRTARGSDPFHREAPDWVRSGKALCGAEIRNPALTIDSPMPGQTKLCAKCVRLSMRDVGGARETREHAVRDYIAVDRNDRKVAGPFKSRHEADGHVPPGGHVKFTTAHRRGPPSPAPSAYPMFRAKTKEAGGRARRPKARRAR